MDYEQLKPPMATMEHIKNAVDWTSVKLNGVSLLGLFTGSEILIFFSCLTTASTFLYNGIRIYKELKNKNKKE